MIDKKRAFDLLNLFLSAIGSTYAAIVPAYLTTQHWSQTQIGLVLTIATVSGLLTQIPAALLADRIRDNWRLAMTAALQDASRIARLIVVDITPVPSPDIHTVMIDAMLAVPLDQVRRRAREEARQVRDQVREVEPLEQVAGDARVRPVEEARRVDLCGVDQRDLALHGRVGGLAH